MKQALKKYHIVYRTVNKLNGKEYIGVHSADTLDDRYLGTGTTMKWAIRKYGRDAFERTNLYVYKTREEALAKEREIVSEEYVLSQQTYNAVLGGGGLGLEYKSGEEHHWWGRHHTDESKRKNSESHKGIPKPQSAQKGEANASYGKTGVNSFRGIPVEVNGIKYDTGKEAASANGISPSTLIYWLQTGRNGAKYLEKNHV